MRPYQLHLIVEPKTEKYDSPIKTKQYLIRVNGIKTVSPLFSPLFIFKNFALLLTNKIFSDILLHI